VETLKVCIVPAPDVCRSPPHCFTTHNSACRMATLGRDPPGPCPGHGIILILPLRTSQNKSDNDVIHVAASLRTNSTPLILLRPWKWSKDDGNDAEPSSRYHYQVMQVIKVGVKVGSHETACRYYAAGRHKLMARHLLTSCSGREALH
jgi:hypothetical protein